MADKWKWTTALSVDNENIDTQHKGLLAQLNKLVEVLSAKEVDMGHLRDANHFLYKYFKEHFSTEENYMAKYGYPELERHKEIHKGFIKFYDKLQREMRDALKSPDFSSLTVEDLLKKVEKYLGDWYVNHIKKVDQKYAKWIRKHSK